jgi:Glycosyl hydrolase 2 galactose-binding domain-like/Exo-beta-D-glucosaminidase Ig-fold domain/Glycosyl hydrolases family 2/NedA-like, galactose-binding domain
MSRSRFSAGSTKSACLVVSLFIFSFSCSSPNKELTRGIGVYPGNPSEDFSPILKPDLDNYRNIALLRPAWHSSSQDYNLTAQLITDGLIADGVPAYFTLSTQKGPVPKNEREWVLDHVTGSGISIEGSTVFIEAGMGGNFQIPELTSIVINGNVRYSEDASAGWHFKVFGSQDGKSWDLLDEAMGSGLPGLERPQRFRPRPPADSTAPVFDFFADFMGPRDPDEPQPSFNFNFGPRAPQRRLAETFEFETPVSFSYYKVALEAPSALSWTIGDFDFFKGDEPFEMAPSQQFNSAWMSAGNVEEWVYVDLGSRSSFDQIKLHWIKKASSGSIQVSDDGSDWVTLTDLPGNEELIDEISLEAEAHGRFVRVLMNGSSKNPIILSELEVMGRGGLIAVPKESPALTGNRIPLAAGSWKIQRASEVSSTGEDISLSGFDSDGWVIATVPGTALVSYWNAGALPDPNYGDNQLMISESFFNSDFWYRNEFEVPSNFKGERFFLNFDGINWKADVFLNGSNIGRIEGAFTRGVFDVSADLIKGEKNALAVRIIKNENIGTIKEQTAISPDKNGGILGGDNPTYHASVGWDWIPTIRGRNIGIWNDVFISSSGAVTLEAPFVYTDLALPDTTTADINIELTLRNHKAEAVSGTLSGRYGPIAFEKELSLEAAEVKVIKLDPESFPALRMENPDLWWPKGYGSPNLYDVKLQFQTADGKISDLKEFKSGVREMSYKVVDRVLNIYINGRRFVGRGGNWGFPESNLNYRGREYDIAVAYHADMNFTMIRNWVGQTGDDEFYEACDRHGIMVWQDFWLANPVDGPNPYDPAMFMDNAEDMILRVRNHPSMAIYVGRNEGNPPEVLDTALRALVADIHPDLDYISNSSMGVVSGGGPYRALPVEDYFLLYGRHKLHSERGMPNVMTYESLAQTLPEDKLWPQNSQWGMHDYCLEGAQGAASFNEIIEQAFGPMENAEEFTEMAQWINYDGYRGMFEGRSKFRKGLLLWMSHSAWPSMVWQTYDWYFDPTGAYFGCKKASEPLHIQWNPVYDSIEVVNLSSGQLNGLLAKAQLINMDGSVQWEKEATLDSNEDSTEKAFKLEFPESLSATHFVKLILMKGEKLLSDNFYWRGLEEGNYQALNDLPKVELTTTTTVSREGEQWILESRVENQENTPALMIRLKITGASSGERILPAFFSDNFFSLLPGESKTIRTSVKVEDSRGEKPTVELSGFNLK